MAPHIFVFIDYQKYEMDATMGYSLTYNSIWKMYMYKKI